MASNSSSNGQEFGFLGGTLGGTKAADALSGRILSPETILDALTGGVEVAGSNPVSPTF